jgi:hypothetical protein
MVSGICGSSAPNGAAAYERGAGEKATFKDETVGLSVEVLGKTKSEYKVRVNLEKDK